MVDRILLDFSTGTPLFRISRPGRDVSSTNPNDFLLTETSLTFRPYLSGSVAFGGAGTSDVPISGFSASPIGILKCSDGTVAHPLNYFGRILGSSFSTLRLTNNGGARTIYYWLFANTLAA